jgi:predicted integral membrane protein DUF2269
MIKLTAAREITPYVGPPGGGALDYRWAGMARLMDHDRVVWMQMRMRDLAVPAVETNSPLSDAYSRLFWWWFAFGFPAFGAVLLIFWLMIARRLFHTKTRLSAECQVAISLRQPCR